MYSLEICAGAGGQALGLEQAGFKHVAAVEIDADAVRTIGLNRPFWRPSLSDVRLLSGTGFKGIDLLAGGVPCPPFSIAGKQRGEEDERDLFPAALRLIQEAEPAAIMLENVPGFASAKFETYRNDLVAKLSALGYATDGGRILNACDFDVPQLRPRFILVAMRPKFWKRFVWPAGERTDRTVGSELFELMAMNGWGGAAQWSNSADDIAPTIVGGSKKHGGPDLGPTRAKLAWKRLHVDGMGIADAAPSSDFPRDGFPKLTVRMTATLQGFPQDWIFSGRKTAAYRQVGNAFPPPVAFAVGKAIMEALRGKPKPARVNRLQAAW